MPIPWHILIRMFNRRKVRMRLCFSEYFNCFFHSNIVMHSWPRAAEDVKWILLDNFSVITNTPGEIIKMW